MISEQLILLNYPKQTSGASDFRDYSCARIYRSQASKKACKTEHEADCFMRLCDCLQAAGRKIDPNGYSSRMLKIFLALEEDLTSRGCSLKWGGYGYDVQWQVLRC